MSVFKKIFGVEASQIQRNCLILPYVNKEIFKPLGCGGFQRGKLYAVAQGPELSLIHAGMGPLLTGDAVLYLKSTLCQRLFFFGTCGSLGGFDVGDIIVPVKSYAQGEFSRVLKDPGHRWAVADPNKGLIASFKKWSQGLRVKTAICLSVSSLKLEEECLDHFQNRGVDVVDMELCAFFTACGVIGHPGMALFVVSDIIGKKPFFEDLGPQDQKALSRSTTDVLKMLCRFIKEN